MKPWAPAVVLMLAAAGLAGYVAARSLGTKPEQNAHAQLVRKPHSTSASNAKVPSVAPLTSQQRSPLELHPLFIGSSRDIAVKAMFSVAGLPVHLAIPRLAASFLGRPYNAFSLDKVRAEVLKLDLTSFDCFLFVEQLLALANSNDINRFIEAVRDLRYEDGQVNYCSRFHYFTHWADNATREGLLLNLSSTVPYAVSRSVLLDYMSAHAIAYAPMHQKKNRDCITQKELSLVANQTYVPIHSISSVEGYLRSGDIFALVTDVQGLDVTHVGFLLKDPKGLNAIHAAPGRGVMISLDFTGYARSVPNVIGVALYRPLSREQRP